MKFVITILITLILSNCATPEKKITPPIEKKPFVKAIEIGWIDIDTYRVKVTDVDEAKAINHAKHQILKDIVNVRVRNISPYTDISKIQVEFHDALENGKVIKRSKVEGGILIHFEIREKGLKKKFERY